MDIQKNKFSFTINVVVLILRRVVHKLRFVCFPCQPMHIWLFYDKFIVEKQFLHSKRRKTKGNNNFFQKYLDSEVKYARLIELQVF